MYAKVIITEDRGTVSVPYIILGPTTRKVTAQARYRMRHIIEAVTTEAGVELDKQDIMSALKQKHWWTDLDHETFTVTIQTPEDIDMIRWV